MMSRASIATYRLALNNCRASDCSPPPVTRLNYETSAAHHAATIYDGSSVRLGVITHPLSDFCGVAVRP